MKKLSRTGHSNLATLLPSPKTLPRELAGGLSALHGLAVCVLILFLALQFSASAANVFGSFTNRTSNTADTNAFRIIPIESYINADGSFITKGLPIRVTPRSNGYWTNYLNIGHYVVTNAYVSQGFLIRVEDAGPAYYCATCDIANDGLAMSGFNRFVTIRYGTNVVTYTGVTNALGFLPLTPQQTTNTAAQQSQFVTNNLPVTYALSNALVVASNSLFSQISTATNNGITAVTATNISAWQAKLVTNNLPATYAFSNALIVASNVLQAQISDGGFVQTNISYAAVTNGDSRWLVASGGVGVNNGFYNAGYVVTNGSGNGVIANGIGNSLLWRSVSGGLAVNNLMAFTPSLISIYTNFQVDGVDIYTLLTNSALGTISGNTLSYSASSITAGSNSFLLTTTNVINVSGAGTSSVNGTFNKSAGASWTNQGGILLTNIAGNYFLQSGATTYYSSSGSPVNPSWTVVSGSAPGPDSRFGEYLIMDGMVFRGTIFSTNLDARLATIATSAANAWNLSGNSGLAASNSLGTLDSAELRLVQSNSVVFRSQLQPGNKQQAVMLGVGTTNNGSGGFVAGAQNVISGWQPYSSIAGGRGNIINGPTNSSFDPDGGGNAFVGLSGGNVIQGGYSNTITVTIGGALVGQSTIGGGALNIIKDNGADGEVIAGGLQNTLDGSPNSVISGGYLNSSTGGSASTIAGGAQNVANGHYSFIGGGNQNSSAGSNSVAMGFKANAAHAGSVVFSDVSTNAQFSSTAANQLLIRASGGVGINTNNPGTNALKVRGNIDSTVGFSVNGVPVTGGGGGITLLQATNAAVGSAVVEANAIFTDLNGANTNSGNSFTPKQTLASAFAAATVGTTIFVGEGSNFLGGSSLLPRGGGIRGNGANSHIHSTNTLSIQGPTLALSDNAYIGGITIHSDAPIGSYFDKPEPTPPFTNVLIENITIQGRPGLFQSIDGLVISSPYTNQFVMRNFVIYGGYDGIALRGDDFEGPGLIDAVLQNGVIILNNQSANVVRAITVGNLKTGSRITVQNVVVICTNNVLAGESSVFNTEGNIEAGVVVNLDNVRFWNPGGTYDVILQDAITLNLSGGNLPDGKVSNPGGATINYSPRNGASLTNVLSSAIVDPTGSGAVVKSNTPTVRHLKLTFDSDATKTAVEISGNVLYGNRATNYYDGPGAQLIEYTGASSSHQLIVEDMDEFDGGIITRYTGGGQRKFEVLGTLVISGGMSGDIPLTNFTAYAAGTAYTLTATPALLDFGTTDPSVTINQTGTYLLHANVGLRYAAATYATEQTCALKLRKTSGTPADVTNGSRTQVLPVLTTFTGGDTTTLPPVIFSATAGDVIQIFGSVSATPSAGSVTTTSAEIVALRIY